MYYRMTCDSGGEPNVYIEELSGNENARIRGGQFIGDPATKGIVELPFRFEMRVRRNADDTRQEPRLSAYYYAVELMQKRLVEALRSAGVHNLQVWPAVITEQGTSAINEDYVVVNVVGLVAAASASASDSIPFADGVFFKNLVIDPRKAHGLLLFRLAESKMDVLVHEDVAKVLMKQNFQHLVLTPVEESRE